MVDPSSPASPVSPGDILAGKYRVERVLGIGGMGIVVAAHHVHLEERVAIKFLLPTVAREGGEPVARFMREGRAAVKIRSEHIARVTDVGMLDDGAPYLVMEYLEGRDLQRVLEEEGPLHVEDAVDYVLQASEAIAEAHSLGIVHRDLKPANLFLARRADGSSCVKVLDFGISKMRDKNGVRGDMTRTRATLGSPLYMSPEQLVSTADVDARADLWSLGVILYELLTARLPFEAETMPQLVAQVLQTPPTPLRSYLPDVPMALDVAILRCLEKTPAARFQNIGELTAALAPVAPARAHISIQRVARLLGTPSGLDAVAEPSRRASRPGSLPDVSPDVSPYARTAHPDQTPRVLAQSGSLSASASMAPGRPPRSRMAWLLGIGAPLVIAAGVAGLVLARGGKPPSTVSSVSGTVAAAPPPAASTMEPPPEPPPPVASSVASSTVPAPKATARPRATGPAARPKPTRPSVIPDDRQ
jgi:serine/threonine protein kinase